MRKLTTLLPSIKRILPSLLAPRSSLPCYVLNNAKRERGAPPPSPLFTGKAQNSVKKETLTRENVVLYKSKVTVNRYQGFPSDGPITIFVYKVKSWHVLHCNRVGTGGPVGTPSLRPLLCVHGTSVPAAFAALPLLHACPSPLFPGRRSFVAEAGRGSAGRSKCSSPARRSLEEPRKLEKAAGEKCRRGAEESAGAASRAAELAVHCVRIARRQSGEVHPPDGRGGD